MKETKKHSPKFGSFVGSAVVAGAAYAHGSTILKLQTFAGNYIDYVIGGGPDPAGAAEFASNDLRPISVKIQLSGERCSVLALASDGPRRSNVTLGTALALHQSGVHTLVEGGLQTRVTCSVQTKGREHVRVAINSPASMR
jgi:hypothetical protein